jgi:hypothetical protein
MNIIGINPKNDFILKTTFENNLKRYFEKKQQEKQPDKSPQPTAKSAARRRLCHNTQMTLQERWR